MTISSETRKAGPYTGNSVTTNFSFDFRVFESSELQVIFTDDLNVESILVLDSDYSVTLNEEQSTNPGGYITYPHPESDPMPDNLSASEKLTLLGNVEYTQEVNIQNQGGFYPEVFENALDKLTMLIQQVKGVADRSIVVPVSSTVEPEDYLTTINQYKLDAEAALAALQESIGTDIQAQLVSGTNIKTINGESVLGSGNLVVSVTVEDGDKGEIVVTDGIWSLDSAIATDISLGVTAYSWGNHASAGYLLSSTAASTYQPLDADLSAIGGLTGTSGLLKKTAANTWTLDTTAYTSNTGTVTSVGLAAPTGLTVSGSPVTSSGNLTLSYSAGYSIPTTAKQGNWDTAYSWGNHASAGYLDSADIGVSVQAYSLVLANTTASFTTADETKLDGIAAGAEVNVNPDWAAVSGDAAILNKPTLGTLAALSSINDGNWSGADLSVTNGGTGASSASAARSNLGLIIGTDVQAYDADTAKLDVAQSWTAQQTFKELKDTVHTITDGAAFEIDPGNGSIQTITLGANRTPAATNFEAGQVVLLGIDDGTAYTITWTTVAVTWVKAGGSASAPTLASSGFTWVLLWKVGTAIYGLEVGKP